MKSVNFVFVYSISYHLTFSSSLRKVKNAWDENRDMLIQSGAFAIEQLSEALSASASSNKLPDELPQNALRLCAEQVRIFTLFVFNPKETFVWFSFSISFM